MREGGKSHARLLQLASLAGVVGFAFYYFFCFSSSITRGPSEHGAKTLQGGSEWAAATYLHAHLFTNCYCTTKYYRVIMHLYTRALI